MMQKIINADCSDILPELAEEFPNLVIVTDPPFNIGYHYGRYGDDMPDDEYWELMRLVFDTAPSVVIHYPEALHRLSIELGRPPDKTVSWVYNSNTAKQHRDIAFYGIEPDFTKVRQPYKNLNDKRILERLEKGCGGGRLYDWWNVNQVKNVSSDKTIHPCQMPVKVMDNVIGILPDDITVIDPFCGSGTTGIACKIHERPFIGIEIDPDYAKMAQRRIDDYAVEMPLFDYA